MSEYFIQEKQLSNVTRTLVKDENGKSLFLLVGRWGTRGDALSLYAMNGELVASIKQLSLFFGTRFDIYKGFEKVGTLKKILNLSTDFYYINQLRWTVIGDIRNHYYTIHHNNHKIMEMSKATLFSGNYFCLEVENDEDAPLCICIAAVLDYWLYNKKKCSSRNRQMMIDWEDGAC
ncbi:LURP-one-related family protein [Enterococcus sp. BWB1-3]|uniref:LURP-one-related/scramblase family protein n=1 Tax=unclassified Enterococcus TaxID=2608891 RepID=UPI001921D77C|nr:MULTISPECIES: LURP-one-related family protein [unclassified Enterococcus]MBL1227786.1 LURP-one-related family protein [Enterococcus sp. BWB1-3]MCB5952026.1 LURP-one-related family protein [Enterococcus sp. BWT-B8]MCB5954564.1 LURP-one-related family protein [Enterococcus sp. CWB-B31]